MSPSYLRTITLLNSWAWHVIVGLLFPVTHPCFSWKCRPSIAFELEVGNHFLLLLHLGLHMSSVAIPYREWGTLYSYEILAPAFQSYVAS